MDRKTMRMWWRNVYVWVEKRCCVVHLLIAAKLLECNGENEKDSF